LIGSKPAEFASILRAFSGPIYIGGNASSVLSPKAGAANIVSCKAIPNPFNVGTEIVYLLSEPGRIDLSIYSSDGRLIHQADFGSYPAGVRRVKWNGLGKKGEAMPNGIYFVKLKTRNAVNTLSLLLVK